MSSTMNRPLVVKTDDTSPTQRTQLLDRDEAPANLTGATVVMRVRGSADVTCEVVDPIAGMVRFDRAGLPAPTGDDPIETVVDFRVTYTGGARQTFPEAGYQRLVIWPAL